MLKIAEAEFITSAVKPEQYPDAPYLEIAVAGRSNVGKSTLINLLLNRKKIAKTSSTPGKTRLINFFRVRIIRYDEQKERIGEGFFSLVDLPGYGYARVSKVEREKWKTMVQKYLTARPELRLMLLLVDIRHDADAKDIMMSEMLRAHNLPFLIIATKADKIKKTEVQKFRSLLSRTFDVQLSDILPVSALKKTGMEELLNRLEDNLL
jgi:GTP-binding protein